MRSCIRAIFCAIKSFAVDFACPNAIIDSTTTATITGVVRSRGTESFMGILEMIGPIMQKLPKCFFSNRVIRKLFYYK